MNESKIEQILAQARNVGPRERADFVRRACGADETLLSQVLTALGSEATDPEFWNEPAPQDQYSITLEGQRLGPYRLVRKLGSGGMGDVYLAERADDEYQQQVAIKLVRAGVFSTQVQSRLRMERQILATLQHPNIARLLDGGRAHDGTPYLVMEYIDGEPIDAYCDRHRLPLAERIKLVQTICAAVHYAHQNLVVHRDLKPSNILITPDGTPKLLDFGIAKLLETRQSMHTLAVTHFEYRVLTPAHASPEQIRGDAITTSSDIYVLGVLLYELLCGRRPFNLVGSSLSEMERIVCEQEPPRPSVALARLAQESPDLAEHIAACRSTSVARLRKDLQGDLDDIILMAMRKDAGRRYGSAQQLAADLERYLTAQPVTATRDTWLYRTRKFVTRHAAGVTASVTAVLALIAFAVVTFIQSQRIAYERDVANAERTRAEQVSSFLVELFELSDPSKSRGNQVTARELLDIGARRVRVGLDDQPETRATLLGTIGRVYSSLGLYSDSTRLLEEALQSRIDIYGPRHLEVASALVALGDALCEQGQLDACQQRLDAALEMQRELAGPDALEIGATLMSHARLAQQRGALEFAQRYYDESLAIYRRHGQERTPEASSVINELAGLYSYRGDYEQAATLYRTALDIDRQALGRDHPQVAMHIHDLAVALHMQGELDEAGELYDESTQLLTKVLGETHPHTLDAFANYGRFLQRKGELQRAEQILVDVLEANRRSRGPRHPYVAHDLVNVAIVRLDRGAYREAEADLKAALDIYGETLAEDHPYVVSALVNLGRAQLGLSQHAAAEQTLRQAIEMGEKSFGPASPQLALARSTLGQVMLAKGRSDAAVQLLRDSLPTLVKAQGEDASAVRMARAALAQVDTGGP
jgi:serine/threonine protein kinase/Tfp pilus assembly protein PilF